MIITCIKNSGCEDQFYIPDIKNIDELKIYAENNMPIKCYEAYYRTSSNIFVIENMQQCYLYLNNYMYYKNADNYYTVLMKEQYNNLENTYCKRCINYGTYGCRKIYSNNDDLTCRNYEKSLSLKEIILDIFQKS